jgi:glycosyltransferase involved in cell wall biosynthesis
VSVTVAIPVRDGGALLAGALAALARQSVAHELLVCDSGSHDGSVALARSHGARVLEIAPERFSHGGTRNLLLGEARGEHVALLTQDAEPADERWLERLLGGFELGEDVGIVYGPYRPRPDAPAAVRLELERWFRSLAPDGLARVERLGASWADEPGADGGAGPSVRDARSLPAAELIGRRGFFTDANACIARGAWERVPFREVPYAEDRVLAIDMLRAGYAKAFVPGAAVLHSHRYSSCQQLRRSFDEGRGLREVYGWREPTSPRRVVGNLRGELGATRRELLAAGVPSGRRRATLAAATRHHVLRLAGALLGSRAGALPAWMRRRLSLEGRASFLALDLDLQDNRK